MNYLAHAYLSFGDPEILAGNIFSDFVKGKKQFDFPKRVQQGISLHRAIDEFTDGHAATAAAKEFFRPAYRLYASAFIDVVYDHFLANDESIFEKGELKLFAATTYRQLQQFDELFPPTFGEVFHYMQLYDWLYNYKYKEGIFRSFGGLVRRAKYMSDAQPAIDIFISNYDALEKCYRRFFPELKEFAYSTMRSFA
jgi:acyl carrier protein phosphodiesterase